MSNAILHSKDFNQTELDHIAQRYGIYRFETETLQEFKDRILSIFIYASSNTDYGYSTAAARAVGSYPRSIGYIKLTTNPPVALEIKDFGLYADDIKIFDLIDNVSVKDLETYLVDNSIGEIYLSDSKYLNKNLSFILPFANTKYRKTIDLSPGINYLNDLTVIDETFQSDSIYFLTQKASPDLLTKRGDYYYEAATNRMFVYPDRLAQVVTISYCSKNSLIDLVYSPVRVISLSKSDLSNTIYKENGSNRDSVLDQKYMDFMWEALINNNALWKANADGAVSVNGTYYGN
jgi:hypothetical protein